MNDCLTAGVDEVGRGPLCGPVVAAAVILDPDNPILGLADSKKLSENKRTELAVEIELRALSYSIGVATVAEIDRLNILHASMLAMQRSINTLKLAPSRVKIDGNRIPMGITIPAEAIVKGDQSVAEISAASIIAKVFRDNFMKTVDLVYSGYDLSKHKGYPTKYHLEKLQTLGVNPLYRRSFKPVKALLTFD